MYASRLHKLASFAKVAGGENQPEGEIMLEKLRGMAVFASVVRHGSFSGAAKELSITTSAVSQQIRSLETDLGVSLLHRSTRKFSLTEAGESLYHSASQMVKSAEEGRNRVSQLSQDISEVLRIATLPQIANKYLLPALSEWFDKHDELSLHFITLTCKMSMIDDRVDLAVMLADTPEEGEVIFGGIKQMVLASPNYLHGRTVDSLNDLSVHDFITCGRTDILNVKKGDEQLSYKVNYSISSDNSQLSLNLAEAGYGLVLTNELEAQDAIRAGRLVPVLTDYQLPDLYLVAKTSAKNPQPAKVGCCIETLKAYFKTTQVM